MINRTSFLLLLSNNDWYDQTSLTYISKNTLKNKRSQITHSALPGGTPIPVEEPVPVVTPVPEVSAQQPEPATEDAPAEPPAAVEQPAFSQEEEVSYLFNIIS